LVDIDWDGNPYGATQTIIKATVSNSYGSYILSDVAPGTYDLIVKPSEHEIKVMSDVVVTSGQTTTLNITTPKAAKITGIVKDGQGNPIPGARIEWELLNTSWKSSFTASSESGKEGTYSLWINSGTVQMKMSYSPFFPKITNTVVCSSGSTYANTDFIVPSGSISGKITEYGGSTGIVGAYVSLYNSSNDIVTMTQTDSSGDYEFEYITQGTYTVKVSKESVFLKAENVQVGTGNVTVNLSKQGGKITGSITDSNSNAISGAQVCAIDSSGQVGFGTIDANGNYIVDSLTSGTYTVNVFPVSGHVNKQIEDVAVVNGQTTANQNFVLGPDGIITGTVVNTSQVPIPGVQISAFDSNQNGAVGVAITDSFGNYTLRHIPGGTFTVLFSLEDYVSDSMSGISVTVAQTTSGQNMTLSTSGAVITGTVYESDGTTPASGAIVAYAAMNGSIGMITADSAGLYITPELAAGTYVLSAVDAAGSSSGVLEDVVVSGTSLYEDRDITLN
jgi:hypothetical protein